MDERLATLGEIVRLTRANGARFLLVLYPDNLSDPVGPGPSRRASDRARGLERFAAREQVPMFDLSAALGDVRDPRAASTGLREDPHPSPEGHRVIAEALRAPLLDVLGR